jgi:very-short-patch-repair endonuclease
VSRAAPSWELTHAPFIGRVAVAAGLLTRRQLASRGWCRLFPDVYAWAGSRLDHRAWCYAAGLFLGDRGAVSGRSAAYLWGADVLARGQPVEVTVPDRVRLPSRSRLAVVRSALEPGDQTRWAGIPVTTPGRTAFDLARRQPLVEGVVAIDAMLVGRLITRSEVASLAAERPGWPGLPRLRAALRLCDPGAESPMESRLRLLLIAGGLPRPVTQFEVRDRNGLFVARLDLAYPVRRLGIEYEGDHHRGPGVFQQDLRRLNALRLCGWTVLRFAASDIYREPAQVVAVVRAALTG